MFHTQHHHWIEVIYAEKTTPDNAHAKEIISNNFGSEEAIVETKSDGDDEEVNADTTRNEEYRSIPVCN